MPPNFPVEMSFCAKHPDVVVFLLPSSHTGAAATPDMVPAAWSFVPLPVTPVSVEEPFSTKSVLATRCVAVTLFGVVEPNAHGIAQVQPFKSAAFKLLTWVVLAITKGAVPVVTVEVSCPLRVMVVTLIPLLNTGVPLKMGEPL